MIIDCFMWHREADMAELRMRMLPEVDVFIVGEADRTFQGDHKSYSFPELMWGRLAPWADRIVHWPINIPVGHVTWDAERFQREALKDGAATVAGDDDIVVFSDVDEVWRPNMLGLWTDGIFVSRHDFRKMSLYWRWGGPWPGSIGGPWPLMRAQSWQTLRDRRWELTSAASGYHFSWMGEVDDIRAKAQAFSHVEYRDLPFDRMAAEGSWRGGQLEVVTDLPPETLGGWLPDSWFRVSSQAGGN